ncbi:hypothetical protein J4E90_009197 [Alternaria incomplexa]|uniref:uncharacterized protein n=1 Tax=Alternaria incomplexa TaxID=1187928 RepID=UPI00221F9AB0|nr:uncharacterized protein J4E90_009197 [Alternaria incomplexa]KAI4907790.1 hypothetical protein J4E90_009197 [Alternaria incomplexa]
MAEGTAPAAEVPVSDKALRDVAKNVAKILPNFAEKEPATALKELRIILDPALETADLPELENSHRAAASNALCAIIEYCAASDCAYAREAILDDSIWMRVFNIYLQRSGDAKGKSMRQMLLVLTGVITKDQSARAIELRTRATTSFLDIICEREDRIKVKPALQGLAHFLLRDVISITDLVSLFDEQLKRTSNAIQGPVTSRTVFTSFLAWVVHHDTSLSAGHLIKNYLLQARRLANYDEHPDDGLVLPPWIEPVMQTLRDWPDRIQEFKTHVFPHCFLPNLSEYLRFLAYLNFESHFPYKHALPSQLRQSGRRTSSLGGLEEFRILLAAIATGKELNIVKDNDHRAQSTIQIRDGALYLPDDISGAWMADSEPEVRLAGMFLGVYSTSVTKAMSGGILQALKRNLPHLHTDTDANFRREVHGYTQKLFDRLRASTATLAKPITKVTSSDQRRLPFPATSSSPHVSIARVPRQDSLSESLAFITWYVQFLEWELRPTASYQSRITALRSITIVLRSGIDPGVPFTSLSKSAQGQLNWAHGLQFGNQKLCRILLDLILDPFDDVRDAAVSVLQLCLVALPQYDKKRIMSMIPRFVTRAEATMLRTGRADQADGVARAYGMIFALAGDDPGAPTGEHFSSKQHLFEYLRTQLDETLTLARSDLPRAVDGRPVHGTFAALRYVTDQPDFYAFVSSLPSDQFAHWKKAHGDIVTGIESLWSCVYHVLCADAPEGHVPDEVEDESSLDTKEILSYSWRGLKEASVLLRTIILKAPVGDGDNDLVTPELFEKLGRLCFTQLLELRHRGAFSTVSQTFAVFCRRCVLSNISTLRALPEMWYQETLRSIQAKSDAITRRSAGIPAAMSALLAAEPQTGGKLFPRAVKDLVAETLVEAQSTNIEESRLPQVHALNCIKEIFTTSKLSIASETYIGQGLELAAKTLSSSIWPLRNCSLMLFKALIERLLGSDEAQDWKERERAKTSRFSYDNYPSLVKILVELLEPSGDLKIMETPESGSSPMDLHGAEGVFPALQILRQARPPGDLTKIRGLVRDLLPSPHWHMRDMAARTYVSLGTTNESYPELSPILDTVTSDHNEQHGRLLVVKYLLRKLLRDEVQCNFKHFSSLMQQLGQHATSWYISSDCPFVRAAFLDVVSLCGMAMLQRATAVTILSAWIDLTTSIAIGPEYNIGPSDHHGDDLLRTSLAQVYFVDRIILRENSLHSMVSDDYQNIGDALMLLANEDPDTCMEALETMDSILQMKTSNGLTIPLSLVLAHIHRVVLEACDPEVISKAQAVLADALTKDHLKSDFFSLTMQDQVMLTLTRLETQCVHGPPSNMQSALHLLGSFLDHAYTSYSLHRDEVLARIARYIRLLRMTTIDTNPFDTRYAAIESLSALNSIFSLAPKGKTGPLILGLAIVLYDLLNDDDDEIRDLAASTAGILLRSQGDRLFKNTVPILTTHRLGAYLVSAFSTSRFLAKEAIRRLTNTPSPHRLFSTPFANTFARERKEDTSLFAQEKQNLYKDDTLDTMLWSRILLSLSASAVPLSLRTGLTNWVLDGLTALTQTAEGEGDGALGWSTKAEVFTLGMRIFCASEVVMRWGGQERVEVVKRARGFADVGIERGVHGLWIERVERVLNKEVVRMLRRVKGGLLEIAG